MVYICFDAEKRNIFPFETVNSIENFLKTLKNCTEQIIFAMDEFFFQNTVNNFLIMQVKIDF